MKANFQLLFFQGARKKKTSTVKHLLYERQQALLACDTQLDIYCAHMLLLIFEGMCAKGLHAIIIINTIFHYATFPSLTSFFFGTLRSHFLVEKPCILLLFTKKPKRLSIPFPHEKNWSFCLRAVKNDHFGASISNRSLVQRKEFSYAPDSQQ